MTIKVVQTAAQSNPPEHREIDGPKAKGLRRILRIFRLILQPTGYMDDNVRRYGPMFKIGSESASALVYVGDPDVVREIFMLDPSKVVTNRSKDIKHCLWFNLE